MASLSSIRSAINTKLATLTWSGNPVAYVYDHYRVKVQWYPAICFEIDALDAEQADSCHDMMNYRFVIMLLQELTHTTRDAALDRLVAIFDSIVHLFQDDRTLWGLCEGEITPPSGEFDVIEAKEWPLMICTIQLTCKTLYNFS